MSLSGLKKEESNKAKKNIEDFVFGASSKTTDKDKIAKEAKRDQSFLLKLNHYEMNLIDKVFENSKCRSKQELIRSLLVPELERIASL